MSFSKSTPFAAGNAARHAVNYAADALIQEVQEKTRGSAEGQPSLGPMPAKQTVEAAEAFRAAGLKELETVDVGLEVSASISGHFNDDGSGNYSISFSFRQAKPVEATPAEVTP